MTDRHAHIGYLTGLLHPVALDFVASPPADVDDVAEVAAVHLAAYLDGWIESGGLPPEVSAFVDAVDDDVIEAVIAEVVERVLRLALAVLPEARERLQAALQRLAERRAIRKAERVARREIRAVKRFERRRGLA